MSDDIVQVAPLDVLHHQEVDAAVLVGVERGDDVGVLEPAGGLDFALNRRTADFSRANDGGRIFSATSRPSLRWRALKTIPMPPAPSLSRIR